MSNNRQTQVETRERTVVQWVQDNLLILLVVGVFVVYFGNRYLQSRPEQAEVVLTAPNGVAESDSGSEVAEVPAEVPGFVQMGDQGRVLLTLQDAAFIRLQIVETVELKPFLSGLTPQQQAETVGQFVEGFSVAMASGNKTDLYRFGGLLQASVNAGDQDAVVAIAEYTSAFEDDLQSIGPENATAPDIINAVVALDALGNSAKAEEYVHRVVNAMNEAQQQRLTEGLTEQGADPQVVAEVLPDATSSTQPGASSQPAPGAQPGSNAQNSAEPPNASAQNPSVEAGSTAFEPTGLHHVPFGASTRKSVAGWSMAPYHITMYIQSGLRLLSGEGVEQSTYQVLGINESKAEVLGFAVYYYTIDIRRVTPSETRNFTTYVIVGNALDLQPGDVIDYFTMQMLFELASEVMLKN